MNKSTILTLLLNVKIIAPQTSFVRYSEPIAE